jgi:glutamyl-tRNA synthetase
MPRFGHLPSVLGEGNRKLSKRDPESSLQLYRVRGFLPEGFVNYLALLGWSIGGDREFFSLDEMVGAFDITRVNPNPARFDLKKAEAINGMWLRRLEPDDLATRMIPYLQAGGVLPEAPSDEQLTLLNAATPLVQERMVALDESVGMLGFLFVDEPDMDEIAAARMLTPDALPALDAAFKALVDTEEWTTPAIEDALRTELIDGLGLKPREAFGPIRVAVSGRQVSPPLFESLELLGRERTLARLDAAIARISG